ncbi:MAG TPA: deaminase [Myxococcota bacterium]|jgi:dCMP deaminase
MILGVSGLNASGKGEVVTYLTNRSFYAHSLSDVIRGVLKERGIAETRERMIETGRELRSADGPAALATRLIPQLHADRNYVIDSIRHPAEVEALRGAGQRFRLIWVEADEAVRWERMRARARPGDPATREQLRQLEGRELGSSDPAAQQLLAVRALADDTLRNDGALAELHDQLGRLLRANASFERPDWDTYFMNIGRVVATRSNCVKRKVAAVITVDRRIIATGYNGTPRGVANCNEGGCPRCNAFGPAGADLGECLCSHAEENAITQSAYHGVSVRGATLYTTLCPCLMCTKMIINSGIAEVVFSAEWPLGDVSLGLLREAGVKVRKLGGEA